MKIMIDCHISCIICLVPFPTTKVFVSDPECERMPIRKSLCKLNSFSLSSPRLAELLASAAQDGSLQKALSIGKPPDMADDEKAGICTIF